MEVINTIRKIDAITLGNYILKHYGPMSHLKLQKLLFYCDAYHLAYFDEELIADRFEAWVHGPVCRRLYDSLKDKSKLWADIAYTDTGLNEDAEFAALTSEQREFITEILDTLSPWESHNLEAATHNEAPWREARRGYSEADICHVEISKETTRIYYKKDIVADAEA